MRYSNNTPSQKGNALLLIVMFVLVGLALLVYLFKQNGSLLPSGTDNYAYQPTPGPSIQDSEDLIDTTTELDGQNLDSMDSELYKNDSDLNSF